MEIGDKAIIIVKDDQFGGRKGRVEKVDVICGISVWYLLKFQDGQRCWFSAYEIKKVKEGENNASDKR